MPWTTPTLRKVREMVRDDVTASLYGASFIGNNVLRVMSDAMAGLAHHVLRYIDWLALQLLPDTAETEWLDRHGDIWLVNSDGTVGRKGPTPAIGVVTFTGVPGTLVPVATRLIAGDVNYETIEQIMLGTEPSPASVLAIDPGTQGNQVDGATITVASSLLGVDPNATVVVMTGGTDIETDDQLRMRVLLRIRNPPMGGDAMDYVQWTLAVPGVTRAWCSPLEMGMGTVTVRFMCDALRAEQDGFPQPQDIETVEAYLDSQRPVAIKDFFVVAPIPEPIDFEIESLVPDDAATRAAITASVKAMLLSKAAPAHADPLTGQAMPGQTIYAAWVSAAIMDAPDVVSFKLNMNDHPMPNSGALAVLGSITYR